MKFFTRTSILIICLLLSFGFTRAAVTEYCFTSGTGTYSEISGGTVLASGSIDDATYTTTLPFTFTYNGTSYSSGSTFYINSNGWASFNYSTNTYTPISTGTLIIAPFGRDLQSSGTGELSVITSGTSPNRVFTVQWKNWGTYPYSTYNDNLNFQIKLYETSNNIALVYGTFGNLGSLTTTVGLNSSSTDYINRTNTTSWTTTTAGTANNATMAYSSTCFPPSGLTYTYSLTDQTYSSCNNVQNTNNTTRSQTNQVILNIQVVMSCARNPMSATSFTCNTNGTTNTADITNAKLYYTGAGTVFSTTTQFGTAVANPNGTFSFSGSQALGDGINNFWLVYDISTNATYNNYVDAECTSIIVNSTARTPTTTAPTGARRIISTIAGGTYTVGPGGDFSNIEAVVNDINMVGLSGNCTFLITADQTIANPPLIISQWAESGGTGYTVTFQPSAAVMRTISGTSLATTTPLIRLRGCKNVTFDGRFSGSGNYFTIRNDGVATVFRFDTSYISSIYTPATNNTLRNCNIWGAAPTNSSVKCVDLVGSAQISRNKVTYCNLKRAYYGIYCYSNSSSYIFYDNEFSYNVLGDSNIANTIYYYPFYIYYNRRVKVLNNTWYNNYYYGMYMYYTDSSRIESNSMYYIDASTYRLYYAMYIYYGYGDTVRYNDITGFRYMGVYFYYNRDAVFTDNRIHHPSTYSPSSTIYGTYFYPYYNTTNTSATVTSHIARNRYYGMNNMYSGSSGIIGLYLTHYSSSYTYDTRIYNNLFYDFTAYGYSSTAPTTTTQPLGIYIANVYRNTKIYHNTFNFYGGWNGSVTNPLSSCIYVASNPTATNGLEILNNAIINNKSGYAYGVVCGTTFTSGYTNFNNNDYYVPNGYVGYYSSGNRTTLTDWRNILAQDGSSISSSPSWNANDNPRPLSNSPLLGAGTGLSSIVPQDFVGVTRSTTAPTIGAYEQGGDFTGPTISYNALSNTMQTANRTLSADITDYSGVNTTTAPPRLYFKKVTDDNTVAGNTAADNGWKWVNATSINGSIFTFTINYSLLRSSVVVNDEIQYFVVAQDVTSNNNVGGYQVTFPGTPSTVNLTTGDFPVKGVTSYRILNGVSGTYNIGTGQTYTNLTGANGFFNLLNNSLINGDVTVNITSNLIEDGVVALNEFSEEGGSANYTVTFKPSAAANRLISGTFAGGLIRLNGTDRVVFDGSSGGSGRYMTFTNSATSGTIATFQIISNTLGAKFVTIKNCNVSTGFNTSASFAIYVGEATISTSGTGADNDNLTIQNNNISKAYYGIFARGVTTGLLDNLLISDNIIGSNASTDYIIYRGLDIQNVTSPVISQNTIFNLKTSSLSINVAGIEIGGTLNGGLISRNKIYGIMNSFSGGWGAYGINVIAANGLNIENNFIYDVTTMNYSVSSPVFNPFGIRIYGGSAVSNVNIYHNTVNMYGTQTNVGSAASFTAALLLYPSSAISNISIKNNIFINCLAGLSGTKSYTMFFYTTTPSTVTRQCDYNNYYAYGTYGILAGYGTGTNTDLTSISSLQAAFGTDANSKAVAVNLIADNDLHLTGSSVGNSDLYCPLISGVNTDIDGEARATSNLYKGADEVKPIIGFNPNTTVTPNWDVFCDGDNSPYISVTPRITGYADGISRIVSVPPFTYIWYKNGQEITGELNSLITFNPVRQSDSATYWAVATFDGESGTSAPLDMKVESAIFISSIVPDADVCSTDPSLLLDISASGTISGYQWQKEEPNNIGVFNDIIGQTSDVMSLVLSDPKLARGRYRVRVDGPGNCGPASRYSNIATVNVAEPITTTDITSPNDLKNVCTGATFSITATSDGTVFGYQWQRSTGGSFVNLDVSANPTANTPTLVVEDANPSMSGNYRCLILGSPICSTDTVPTQAVQVTVWPLFEILEHPKGDLLCLHDSLYMYVIAEGTIHGFQWKLNGAPIDINNNFSAKSQILYLNDVSFENSGSYTCEMYIEDCSGLRTIETIPTLVYVLSGTEITRYWPKIYHRPGSVAVFEVKAHASGGPEGYNLKVQWYRDTVPIVDNDRISGANSNIMTIKNLKPVDYGTDYKVVVKGKCGSDTSGWIDLSLLPVLTINIQPISGTYCEGSDVSLKVDASVNMPEVGMTYQWRYNGKPFDDDGHFHGTNTSKLIITGIKYGEEGEYDCIVKTTVGDIVAISDKATITLIRKPIIKKEPVSEVNVALGKPFEFTVEAESAQSIRYQWYFNNAPLPNDTFATFRRDAAVYDNDGVYKCKVYSDCGEVYTKTVKVTVTLFIFSNVEEAVAGDCILLANNPNPFNLQTIITFIVPAETEIKLSLSDVFGKELAVLFDRKAEAGTYKVTANVNDLNLISGTYYYTLFANGKKATRKMIVIK